VYEVDLMSEEEIKKEFRSRIAKLYEIDEKDLKIDYALCELIKKMIAKEEKIVELYKEAHEKGMSLKEAILWVSEQLDDT